MKKLIMLCTACLSIAALAEGITVAEIEAKHARYSELKKAAKNRDTDETRALMREIYSDQAEFFARRAELKLDEWLKEGNPYRYNWKMTGFLRASEAGRRCAAEVGDRLLSLPAWGGDERRAKNALPQAANDVLGSNELKLRLKAAGYLRQYADIAKTNGDNRGYVQCLNKLAMTLLKDWLDRPAAIAVYREGFKDASLPQADRDRFEVMIWQLED